MRLMMKPYDGEKVWHSQTRLGMVINSVVALIQPQTSLRLPPVALNWMRWNALDVGTQVYNYRYTYYEPIY
jgi:hypothetical protein